MIENKITQTEFEKFALVAYNATGEYFYLYHILLDIAKRQKLNFCDYDDFDMWLSEIMIPE